MQDIIGIVEAKILSDWTAKGGTEDITFEDYWVRVTVSWRKMLAYQNVCLSVCM